MKKSELFFSFLLVPVDFAMILLAIFFAYYLRFSESVTEIKPVIYNFSLRQYMVWGGIVTLACLGIFSLSGLYNLKTTRGGLREAYRVFISISTAMMALIVLLFFRREFFSSRFIFLAVWSLAIIFVIFGRFVIRTLQRACLKYGYGVHRVALIGNGNAGKILENRYKKEPRLGYKIMARILPNEDILKKLDVARRRRGVDEVIQCSLDLGQKEVLKIVDYCDVYHLVYKFVPDMLGAQVTNLDIETVSGIPIVELKDTPLDGWGRIFKRIADIIFSALFLIIFSPVMIATAIAIKLDSRGPVFFSHLDDGKPVCRVGQHGNLFRYFKFRSMKPKCDRLRYTVLANQNIRKGTPMVKIKNDPRVTAVGKFIRRFSIDELAEFFLVFIGKMSLVGPRPHLPEEVAKYKKHHKRVLKIKPGISGLAQISGRSDLDFEEEVRLDTYYIENWSPRLDLWILLKTPMAVLKKRKAE
ncbi:MAG: sugar transferase [bacterium]|nr:sugar transferase [bacterium]